MYLGSVLGGTAQGINNFQTSQLQDAALKKQQYDLEQQRVAKAKELALAQYGSGVAGQLFAPPPVSQPMGQGSQPPMPGQASQPMAPPSGQPQVPMGMDQGAQQAPAPAVPPYQTVQGAAAQRQAAPQPSQPQMMAPPSVGGAQPQAPAQQPQQGNGEITVGGIVSALRQQNVPQEYWMDVINQYAPIMNAQNKQEALMLKQQLDVAKLGLQEKNIQSLVDYRGKKGGSSGGAGGGVSATGVYDAMPSAEQKRVDFYAGRAMNGDYSWRTGLSRNKSGANFIKAVDERVADLSTEQGITPGESAAAGAEAKGLAKVLADRQKYVANANQFSQTMNGQMDIVLKSLDTGSAGGIPFVNKWKNATREQILGSPELTTFDNALTGLAREHARFVTGLTSNAQLTAAATSTGDRLLNRNMSPEQIKAAIKEMKDEQKAAVAAGKNEVNSLKQQISTVGQRAKGSTAPLGSAENPIKLD
jgi:hypothetical protein